MATVLDTAGIPAAERAEAVFSAMVEATVPCYVVQEERGADIHARMTVFPLETLRVFTTESTGIRLVRTARQARQDARPVIALSVQERAEGRQDHLRHQRVVPPGELLVMDLTAPYDFSWTGLGAARSVQIPVDQLRLPVDLVRDAVPLLPASPYYRMVADHVVNLTEGVEALAADPSAVRLEGITVDLVRALLASASRQDRWARPTLAETRLTRIRAYVRRHLSDPDLTPARIAAAHHLSVRSLYKLCAGADISLRRWIIGQRLEGAREELAHPAGRNRTIATVARRWGFTDPTHFSHRFRDAYGMSPREWRRLTLEVDAARADGRARGPD